MGYNEYAPVNFVYMPYIAVKVVDITPKPNGYIPGLILMQLTGITPEGAQSCQLGPPVNTPEFPAESVMIIGSVALGLLLLRIRKPSFACADSPGRSSAAPSLSVDSRKTDGL